MAGELEDTQAQNLRRELFGLARAEKDVRREIGQRVIAGEPVVDLRALRREIQETQEDLSAAVTQLEAEAP